jgi:hypothetical protein
VALAFAGQYGFALNACDPGDAARKGKVERPFRDLKRGFLAEMDLDPPVDVGELNRRVGPWLDRYVHAVATAPPRWRQRSGSGSSSRCWAGYPTCGSTPPAGSPAGSGGSP